MKNNNVKSVRWRLTEEETDKIKQFLNKPKAIGEKILAENSMSLTVVGGKIMCHLRIKSYKEIINDNTRYDLRLEYKLSSFKEEENDGIDLKGKCPVTLSESYMDTNENMINNPFDKKQFKIQGLKSAIEIDIIESAKHQNLETLLNSLESLQTDLVGMVDKMRKSDYSKDFNFVIVCSSLSSAILKHNDSSNDEHLPKIVDEFLEKAEKTRGFKLSNKNINYSVLTQFDFNTKTLLLDTVTYITNDILNKYKLGRIANFIKENNVNLIVEYLMACATKYVVDLKK